MDRLYFGCSRSLWIRQFFPVLLLMSSAFLSSWNLCQAEPAAAYFGPVDDSPYRHVEVLDPSGKFRLEWLVDWENERVFFNVTVETLGWVGFGIAKHEKVQGADMIMGGVTPNGRAYFTDRYAAGNAEPIIDDQQDWILHSAWESYSHTFLSFSRPFDTCDQHDFPINDDAALLLWAYGESDNTSEYHFRNRGSLTRYLRDPDLTPRLIQEKMGRHAIVPHRLVEGTGVKIWSLKNTFKIPAKRTTYWCNIRKLSLPRKHHIIGFKFKINNESQSNMHHMLLFRCTIPNAASVYEPFLNHPGEECYTQSQQLGQIPFQSCIELKVGHAIGGRPLFFPEAMGIPIGATGPDEFYLLQTHYDNPEGRDDLISENQLDVYYTSRLRPNDGGVLSVGQHIPGSPSILLPPSSIDHRIYGHCSPACTRRMLPPDGIKFVGALLHSHNGGRRLTLQHFRNNRELPHILQDDNYFVNFQPTRLLREEVSVMPGDQVTMRCVYDTTYTNRTTVGGYGTDQEMCKTFILYYNLLEDYTICRSELISPNYTARYLAGTSNVTWDQPRLEFAATSPPHVAGMTLTDISDSSYVSWSIQQRAQLQRDHILHPQVDICPSRQEVQAQTAAATTGAQPPPPPPPNFVTNPVEAAEYRPPQQCSLSG